MADASFSQTNFTGGEFAQYMQGRFDEPQYKSGLNVCLNALPIEEGAWVRRPGTQFAGFSRRAAQGRLIGFDVVATTPYDIELTVGTDNGYMRVWNGQQLVMDEAGATVTSISTASPAELVMSSAQAWSTGDSIQLYPTVDTNYLAQAYLADRQFVVTKIDTTHFTLKDQLGNNLDGSKFALGSTACTASHVLEIETPWSTDQEINAVRAAQSENQMLMFSAGIATQMFTQTGSTFTLADAAFVDGPYLDPPKDGSQVQVSGTSGSVSLSFFEADGSTAKNMGFTSANIGQFVRLLSEPPKWVAGTSYSPGDKTTYQGTYYNCVVATGTDNPPDTTPASQVLCPTAAQWAYAQITAITSDSEVTATLFFIPQPPPPNIVIQLSGPLLYTHNSDNPVNTYQMGLYWGTTWPTCGTFHEGRFWFAGALLNRVDSAQSNNALICSPTFYDGTVADDCGISAIFNFPEIMQIRWMMPTQLGIIAGCQSGEVLVRASQLGDPLTPTSIQAHVVTRYGCQSVDPVQVGFSTLFVERYGKKVLDLTPNVFSQRISAANISLTGRHLTYPGVTEIRWQRELAPVLWCATPNGIGGLIGMTYKREDSYATSGPLFAGWHKHKLGNNHDPESIAVGTVPGGGTDCLALLTKNPIASAPDYNQRHVEFMSPVFQEGQSTLSAVQLDDSIGPVSANVIYSGAVPTDVVFYGFWHGVGRTISAYIGGLDLGDYVVQSDGSITVPFVGLFTLAYLQTLAGDITFVGGAPYIAPTFLAEPAVQSYVNQPGGSNHSEWSGAFGPGTETVFGTGPADSQDNISQFDFGSGALVNQQLLSSVSLLSPPFQSSVMLGGDGKLYWSASGTPMLMYRVDPSVTPYVVSDTASTSDVNQLCDNMAYLTMGSTHWIVAASFSATNVGYQVLVFRADQTPGFGFWGHAYNDGGALGGNADVCAGPQSASSATAYWTNKPFSIYHNTGDYFTLGKTVISAGADAYDPSTWPTTNPDIASSIVASYNQNGSAFDPDWTALTFFSGPAYDQTDGNVIVQVEGTGGGNPAYIVKLSTTDGSILWKVAVSSTGFDADAVTLSRIQAGTYYYWDGSDVHAIETASGTDVTQAYGVTLSISSQVSDDALGCITGNIGWSGAGLTLLNSTASSGSTMGAVYFADGQQPLAAIVATAPGCIGYRYYSQGQLLRTQDPVQSGARNGPAMGKTRRNHKAAFYFINAITGSVSVGTDFADLDTQTFQPDGENHLGESYTVLDPFTGIWRTELNDDYTFDGMICWQTNSAYPLAVGAISGFLETQDV